MKIKLNSKLIIMFFSTAIPIIISLQPKIYEYLFYDKKYILKFQLWRLYTTIFINTLDINLLFTLFTRYSLLNTIEKYKLCINGDYEIDSLFFIFTFPITLILGNLLIDLKTFSSSFNMAIFRYVCQFVPEINFYGFHIPSEYALYVYLGFEILTGRNFNAAFGLLHAIFYITIRKKIVIPLFFDKLCRKILFERNRKIKKKIKLV